ncbi:DUF2807 domain-containing protein [Burkholderia metallica]|uniref:GIN domain-containing protein n=1 Tax=Burkholderia metallica TaxID=488729 RepID=UPI00157AEE6F|nr:DUF2807 domain-containing protein [Burkholderia metallica]NTZ86196.1 DUF2807 domain-containing protein [Burkholderia metallica]
MSTENQIQEQRPIRPVRKIVIKGSADVMIHRSDTPSMVVSGDTAEAVAAVKTDLQGDKLVIENVGTTISGGITVFPGTDQPFTLVSRSGSVQVFHKGVGSTVVVDGDIVMGGNNTIVTGRNIVMTTVRAVVTIALPEIAEVRIKGSGDVVLTDVQQDSLSLKIEGSGDITVDGKVAHLDAEVCGSGDVDTRDLIADHADLSVMGSGDIKALVQSEAHATVTGSGDIVVHGNPAIRDKRVVGSGRIKFK